LSIEFIYIIYIWREPWIEIHLRLRISSTLTHLRKRSRGTTWWSFHLGGWSFTSN